MANRLRFGAVLAGAVAAPGAAVAQGIPAAPPAALPGGIAAPAAAAPAAAAPARNLISFFCLTPEQKAACKVKFCKSGIGKLINGALLPVGAATGGLIGPLCPDPRLTPDPEALKKPPESVQGAAAKIKAEEAQVAAKVADVEYLGTVDCRYYPEAEAALIAALRAEKSECVRLAAAKALASGCCCSAKIIKALTICVNGANTDKLPAERSELVQAYAYVALERCLARCDAEPIEDGPKEKPAPPVKDPMVEPAGGPPVRLAFYLAPPEPAAKVQADGRAALARGLRLSRGTLDRLQGPRTVRAVLAPSAVPAEPTPMPTPAEPPPPAKRTLLGVLKQAVGR